MVLDLQARIKPDLLGVEGCYDESCSDESEMQDAIRAAKDFGIQLPPIDILRRSISIHNRDSWHVLYRNKYPESKIVGIDDYHLHNLDNIIMKETAELGLPEQLTYGIRDPLLHLRSDLAIARMGHLLQKHNLQHGTITMGYWHGTDFKRLIQELGISSKIYVAVPTSVLKEQPERFQFF